MLKITHQRIVSGVKQQEKTAEELSQQLRQVKAGLNQMKARFHSCLLTQTSCHPWNARAPEGRCAENPWRKIPDVLLAATVSSECVNKRSPSFSCCRILGVDELLASCCKRPRSIGLKLFRKMPLFPSFFVRLSVHLIKSIQIDWIASTKLTQFPKTVRAQIAFRSD